MDKPFNPDHEILDYFDSLFAEQPANQIDAAEQVIAEKPIGEASGVALPSDAVVPARLTVPKVQSVSSSNTLSHTMIQARSASSSTASSSIARAESNVVAALRRQPVTNTQPQTRQAALAELEAVKREQLQALLSQNLPKVVAKRSAPKTTERPKPVTAPPIEASPTVTSPDPNIASVPVVINPVEDSAADTAVDGHINNDLNSPTEDETAVKSGVNAILAWEPNGRPVWAQQRFDVLLFDVSGLTLAVPLVALGQIQQINESLTPIFGQSEWFMGLLKTANGPIKTLNTALFVMPEKYDQTFLDTAKYVVTIDGLPWGLAVNSVNQPVTLEPSDVVWRSQRTKRPWLAGTVKSAMCALVDIPQMAAILSSSEKKSR